MLIPPFFCFRAGGLRPQRHPQKLSPGRDRVHCCLQDGGIMPANRPSNLGVPDHGNMSLGRRDCDQVQEP